MSENKSNLRKSGPRFHQPRDEDDPLLRYLRQDYLIVLSGATKSVPESLHAVLEGKSTLEEWLDQVHFRDQWLRAAAEATLSFWRENFYDGLMRTPSKGLEISQYGVPGTLQIVVADQWMPHRGDKWQNFERRTLGRFVRIFNRYHRRSVGAWGKQQEDPSFENLRLLAKYQANEIRNPDETAYKRVVRTAKRLGLTLRPKNNRTSESF